MNKLIIQLRNGSSGSPALMIMPLSFIKVGKEKAAKQQGLLFLHARANLPQTSDLIACTRHCASIITACCMRHAVVLRKHQRLLHAACLGLSEKNTLILCGGLAVAVPIARLLHVSIVILEGSTASAGSTHEHSKKRETGISKQRCNHGDKKWLP